jgi:hypothetical protein
LAFLFCLLVTTLLVQTAGVTNLLRVSMWPLHAIFITTIVEGTAITVGVVRKCLTYR